MKSIVYRGGVVTFRIPAHWHEEYSDLEGGTFFSDHPQSGTLRLSIITVSKPHLMQPPTAADMLEMIVSRMRSEGVSGIAKERKDGNAVFKYEDAATERGTPLAILYWLVVNPVPPRHGRIATFSYTVLARQRNRPQVQQDMQMLDAEIEAAVFLERLGVVEQ